MKLRDFILKLLEIAKDYDNYRDCEVWIEELYEGDADRVIYFSPCIKEDIEGNVIIYVS